MAEQLLLVNPSRRAGRDSKGRFIKRGASRKRRRNPARRVARRVSRRVARRRNPVAAMNPRRRSYRRGRRRNPISLSNPVAAFVPAIWGGVGAVAVNAAISYVPLPATFKTGNAKMLTGAVAALLLGTFGRRLIGPRATDMANGALTVIAYDAVRQLAGKAGLPLGAYADDFPVFPVAANPMLSDLPTGGQEYIPAGMSGVEAYADEFVG